MQQTSLKAYLCAGVALGAIAANTTATQAGGFAIREQSTAGQGTAFAGVAAGGAPSSMFWNPATMTQSRGLAAEADLTGIAPFADNAVRAGSTFAGLGGTGDVAPDTAVPSLYAIMQVNPNLWMGLSVNSPFGLSDRFPDAWAGRNYALDTKLHTYNATPSIAYKINDWISIGVGAQLQYASADLENGIVAPGFLSHIAGRGWGFGATAGVTLTPGPSTEIGVGWRSAIDQAITGGLSLAAPALPPFAPPFSTPGSVSTTIRLPDVVSAGIRQRVTDAFTVMGTVEWSNWSRIGTSVITQPGGAPALVATSPVTLPFQYRDGWYAAIGGEYQWTPRLALRAGIAFESSPVTDQVRTPVVPDADRLHVATGLSYAWTQRLTLDLAYTHIFVDNAPIDISATSGNPFFNSALGSYVGTSSPHIDILSLGLRYKFEPAPPSMPLKTKG
ncbi:MAG TPA: OmpP1/FadL family transporter [Xanthobacteraceae bacterium]|nr:OmpP1/FadL family transporter [Xanthobacteraceae bacterium]